MDINPQSKGHVLLIPKEQVGRIEFVPTELLNYLMHKVQEIIIAIKKGVGCDYVQIEMVGKGVPDHFHIHLIPRMEVDEIPESPYKKYSEGEAQNFAHKITSALG